MLILYIELLKKINFKRKIQSVFLIIFSVFTSIIELLTILTVFPVISLLLGNKGDLIVDSSGSNFFNNLIESYNFDVETIFPFFIFLVFFAGISKIFLLWAIVRFSHAVGSDLAKYIFNKTLKQSMEFFYETSTSEIVSNLSKKNFILSMEVINPSINLISNLIMISIVLFGLVYFISIYILLLCLGLLIIFLFIWFFTKNSLNKNSVIISKNSDYLIKYITESFSTIKLIIMSKLFRKFSNNFDKINRQLKYAEGHNLFLSQSSKIIVEVILILSACIVSLIIYKLDLFLQIVPIVGALLFSVVRIMPVAVKSYAAIAVLIGAKETFRDIVHFLKQTPPKIKEKKVSSKIVYKNFISFDDVVYKFANNKTSVRFDKIKIYKNHFNCIVGPTGSGKTTLISLLIGLLKPSTGNIKIDNNLVNLFYNENWQEKIGYVPQETVIIDGTLMDNLTIGNDKKIDSNILKKVLKDVELSGFIDFLDTDYNFGENGSKLSGGERQRIGLARSLIDKKDILILDEPFSSLDKITAKQIFNNLRKIKNITVIIITHDSFAIPLCDYSIRLKKNAIKMN